MRKNSSLSIPMISDDQSVIDYIQEKFITYDELSHQLNYRVSGNTLKNWLIGKYQPPQDFEAICKNNLKSLEQYSIWKLRFGVFENYPKRKPQGFWQRKETHRYALEWICDKKGWDFPYGLYQLKKETLFELNIDGITNIYSESPTRIVTTILPEYDWYIWKFQMTPMGFWNDDSNKIKYLKWFERQMGIKKPEDWYSISINDLYHNHGRTLIVTYFSGSIGKIVKFLYPNLELNYTSFIRTPPSLFDWSDLKNVKKVIEQVAQENDLEYPSGYYKLSIKKHFHDTGIKFRNYGVKSFAELLNKIYSDHRFYEWLFEKTPNGFWKDESNLIDYIKWLCRQLKIESLDEWYDVSRDIISHYQGAGLLSHSGKNIYELVSLAYPEHKWDESKFGQKKFTSQRRLYKILTHIYPNTKILYNKRHPDIINPKTNKALELDCFIPELGIAFEYQGAQHQKPNRFFHSNISRDSFKELQKRDMVKKKMCKKLGIKLIEVFDGDWDYSKNDLLRIINSGINKK